MAKFHFAPFDDFYVRETMPLTDDELVDKCFSHFTGRENLPRLNMYERGEIDKEEYGREVMEYCRQELGLSEARAEVVYKAFYGRVWSYHVIDELIKDASVSDIRIIDYNHIYATRFGKSSLTGLQFKDKSDYDRFIKKVALKNNINIGNNNAVVFFTDWSLKDWILRFDISTDFVVSSGNYITHIRKNPKKKKNIERLISEGMLDEKQAKLIKEKQEAGESFLIVGQSGAGKTTLLNAMIEQIPDGTSVCCIEELHELQPEKPMEWMGFHTTLSATGGVGEERITYSLETLGKYALLMSTGLFILGEVKGKEARDLVSIVHSGTSAYACIHAGSVRDGFYQIADYAKRSPDYTDYSLTDILFLLRSVKNGIFIKDYKICEITEIGWNYDTAKPEFNTVYRR